jgi:hypothetical protein
MTKQIEVKSKKEVNGEVREATVFVDFGETAAESIEMFGDEVVNSGFIAASKITAQGGMRRMLEVGKAQEEITAKMAEWKPGVTLSRETDPMAAALAKFGSLSEEEKEEFLQQLRDKAAE